MPWYGFTAYERRMSGVKGLVEADSIEEAKAKIRSRTFPGIAKAFATQWAGECEDENNQM